MKLIGAYENGNYNVAIFEDGTKIRETQDDEFISFFPECIDLKITNRCDMGCAYCHEDSTRMGEHGDILNAEFINTLRPHTELALGGGNVLSHPDLIEFLYRLKQKNIIANITVNQKHFMQWQYLLGFLAEQNWIRGIGVSLTETPNEEFINAIKSNPNIVLHVINGIVNIEDLRKLSNHGIKILILGYKEFRRGKDFYNHKVEFFKDMMYDNIKEIATWFKVISFDNLAIRQLDLKRIFKNDDMWDEFYMGDDGQHTMYIDLVKRKYALNSTATERYDLLDGIDEMFNHIKNN
jgi:hypothetical protein